MKIPTVELSNHVDATIGLFVCTVSFDNRCLAIAESLKTESVENCLLIWNEDYRDAISSNLAILKDRFGSKAEEVVLSTREPLASSDELRSKVLSRILSTDNEILVDITSFTHEHLIIFVKQLLDEPVTKKVKLLYSGAEKYSTNTSDEEAWLSRGVESIRTVLGFPGLMLPSRPLHVITLVGFEAERAQEVILAMEPKQLTLGRGRSTQSVTDSLHQTNVIFHKRVEEFVKKTINTLNSVDIFEFSCVDPSQTMNDILETAQKFPAYNSVICTLNTKPSTVGAAMAAQVNSQLQLIYAQPIEYNTDAYSSAGDKVTIYDFGELLKAVEAKV